MFVKLTQFCLIILALIFLSNIQRIIKPLLDSDDIGRKNYKYILIWTPEKDYEKLMGWNHPELDGFKKAGCPEYRCYLTNNRSFLGR